MERMDVVRLALVLSKQAEIEAMKVENLIREQQGLTPAYPSEIFFDKANELENLAYSHDDQL